MKHVARAVFWVVFLAASGAIFAHQWKKNDPLLNHPLLLDLRVRYNVLLLSHPHPEVASEAWTALWNLFHRKWRVYHALPAHFADATPIHFLIVRQRFPANPDMPALEAFSARPKPIYHAAERVYCRTVGEALMAILYREGKWKVDYRDDWNEWWVRNRTYYHH
jgi:hypothetical protein